MRGVGLKRVFEIQPDQHASPLRIFETISFGAPRAKPKMLNGVRVSWLPIIQGTLMKTKEAALTIIKFGSTRRIGTLGKHAAPPTPR